LWHAQNLVNAVTFQVVGTTSLTTRPRQQVYPMTPLLPAALRVISVRYGAKDLARVPNWRQLGLIDRAWFRRVGPDFEAWAAMGRDLLVVHPGKDVVDAVDVVYAKVTTRLDSDDTPTEVSDDLLPLLLDVAEATLLVGARDLNAVQGLPERIQKRLTTAVATGA
jgi:hypothetical protein